MLPGCGFRVSNYSWEWTSQCAWIFDDTIEREAWNDCDALRVIPIFDIWNPLLTLAEHEMLRALLAGIREYYSECKGDGLPETHCQFGRYPSFSAHGCKRGRMGANCSA